MNDLVQISTFLLHGDWWFAAVLSFFIFLSLGLTIPKMWADSDLQRFDPLGEARLSLARGVPTVAWERIARCGAEHRSPEHGAHRALRRNVAGTHAAAGSQLPLWALHLREGHGRGPAACGGRP